MADLKVKIERYKPQGEKDSPEARKRLHRERAKLVHGLVDTLNLEVVKDDWGNTDSEEPREFIEIIIALGTAGVFTAMVSAFHVWLRGNVIEEIHVTLPPPPPGGRVIDIKGVRAQDLPELERALGIRP